MGGVNSPRSGGGRQHADLNRTSPARPSRARRAAQRQPIARCQGLATLAELRSPGVCRHSRRGRLKVDSQRARSAGLAAQVASPLSRSSSRTAPSRLRQASPHASVTRVHAGVSSEGASRVQVIRSLGIPRTTSTARSRSRRGDRGGRGSDTLNARRTPDGRAMDEAWEGIWTAARSRGAALGLGARRRARSARGCSCPPHGGTRSEASRSSSAPSAPVGHGGVVGQGPPSSGQMAVDRHNKSGHQRRPIELSSQTRVEAGSGRRKAEKLVIEESRRPAGVTIQCVRPAGRVRGAQAVNVRWASTPTITQSKCSRSYSALRFAPARRGGGPLHRNKMGSRANRLRDYAWGQSTKRLAARSEDGGSVGTTGIRLARRHDAVISRHRQLRRPSDLLGRGHHFVTRASISASPRSTSSRRRGDRGFRQYSRAGQQG